MPWFFLLVFEGFPLRFSNKFCFSGRAGRAKRIAGSREIVCSGLRLVDLELEVTRSVKKCSRSVFIFL